MNRNGTDRIVEVAAAILLRDVEDGCEYLLAQRPADKVYAGYWEFPGGKVEPGESFRDALVRELREELCIGIEQAAPWVCREFVYPHAHVRLKFFRVTSWHGEIHPHEHTGAAWTRLGETPAVDPVLPANGPILRALELPATYAITNAQDNGIENELARIGRALGNGLQLLQIRDKALPGGERRRFALAAMALVRKFSGVRVLVNDDEILAREIGADGVHLSSRSLHTHARRPDFEWVAASCHNCGDLERAVALGLDFAVLGPVLPTLSHPETLETGSLGWDAFERMTEHLTIPVYALGGMQSEFVGSAQSHGAHGIALMRSW